MKVEKLLLSQKSKYQSIKLIKDSRGLLFRLNGSPQVHSAEQGLYHENVATAPMMLARKVDHCLILGGGDGLAARNILRFKGVKSVHLVELDPAVTDLWSRREDLSAINEKTLTDPRLTLVIGDAIQWIMDSKKKFDIIISDVAVSFTRQPRAMTLRRYFDFFRTISEKLAPGGVAVLTISDDPSDEELIQGFFEEFGKEMMSPEKRKAFARARDLRERARLLTGILFPHSLQWTIRLKALGPHTSFYLSHQPMTKLRRSPNPPPEHIGKDFVKAARGGN